MSLNLKINSIIYLQIYNINYFFFRLQFNLEFSTSQLTHQLTVFQIHQFIPFSIQVPIHLQIPVLILDFVL